ncbi:MAG TPA: amino acid permease, partial [Caldilineaceae bacterium]|nr:amino acid permease [Caldilineaceae bacterium]
MAQISSSAPVTPQLRREVGFWGAVMMGFYAIIGTGVFVGIGIAAGIAGPAVLLAILVAGLVALCNGLSSAQLAESNSVSGSAYEHGYRYLHPTLGFVAGWMFLCAQSASAATAALGFAGYLLSALDVNSQIWRIGLGLAGVVLLTMLVLSGIRQLHFTIWLVVGLTLGSLFFFVAAGLPAVAGGVAFFEPFFPPPAAGVSPARALFHAAALMFVAYTGYGRIVALGE